MEDSWENHGKNPVFVVQNQLMGMQRPPEYDGQTYGEARAAFTKMESFANLYRHHRPHHGLSLGVPKFKTSDH